MRLNCLKALLIIISIPSIYAQKKISGDTLVFANSTNCYAIKAQYQSIEWELYPQSFGAVIDGQGTENIVVQWNASALDFKHNPVCTLIVKIKYPNADMAINFAKQITIINSVDSSKFKRRSINSSFSKTNKDNLRFFYKIRCDTSVTARNVIFNDSSSNAIKTNGILWTVEQKGTEQKQITENTVLNLILLPGHYSVTLQRQTETQTLTLTDTLTIYAAAKPSFTISSQIPCSQSLVTFTNTSLNAWLSVYSVFNFGNGSSLNAVWPEKTVQYSYDDTGMSIILMTSMASTDLHGCIHKSVEIPIAVQENKFTRTNVMLEPRSQTLKFIGDSVIIKTVLNNGFSPPNPNAPFTYYWNTGQTSASISIKEPGEYNYRVTDKYGCKSETSPSAKILKSYEDKNKPKITGPANVKAGNKLKFSIEECYKCLYQWKFIYNDGVSLTTEPDKTSKITPEGAQKLPPGTLKVIGIQWFQKSGSSLLSDTLRVLIKE